MRYTFIVNVLTPSGDRGMIVQANSHNEAHEIAILMAEALGEPALIITSTEVQYNDDEA